MHIKQSEHIGNCSLYEQRAQFKTWLQKRFQSFHDSTLGLYSTHICLYVPSMPAWAALCSYLMYCVCSYTQMCVFIELVAHSQVYTCVWTNKLWSHCSRLHANKKLLPLHLNILRAIMHLFAMLRPLCMRWLFTHLFTRCMCMRKCLCSSHKAIQLQWNKADESQFHSSVSPRG